MSKMHADRTGYEFLLHRAQRSAWRWECQGIYHDEPGVPDEHTPRSTSVTRVWALARPLTIDQQRALDTVMTRGADYGEHVGVISEDRAIALGLPDHDFWIIDDEYVILLKFTDHRCSGVELLADEITLTEYRAYRDLAEAHAIAAVPEPSPPT